ncbi:MAG TPA: glycosyltransferase family 2 protein [Polyangiaceae bacterium]|jgi:undecaprenyl-phosphate 4-deoxy-4-formamido-L-arabinose transferase|nr:glycosyltransferase family 2 protein [Polyangiaceae bacterium]
MSETNRPTLSVVVPVYGSQDCVAELAARVASVCQEHAIRYELLLVYDCSPDRSWQAIQEVVARDPAVVGVRLRKNFGQDNAIMAGMNLARGEAIAIMDDDLQHDPADLPALLAKLREGYDLVYARYRRTHQKRWKNMGSWFNGKVAEVVLSKPPEINISPYKIVAADVVATLIQYRGPYPYVDGLLFRTTANIAEITVQHHPRLRGRSNYTFWKSVAVWARLATNFSVVPLRIATFAGLFIAGVGLLLALGFLIWRLNDPTLGATAIGWASLIVSILVLGGFQLMTLGVLGEYVGRTHLNVNQGPQYVVGERIVHPGVAAPEAPRSVNKWGPR